MTPWTVARQAPLSMGFSRQEYWSGLPCPPPGDLPHPGTKLVSRVSCTGRWIFYHQHHLSSFFFPVSLPSFQPCVYSYIYLPTNTLVHSPVHSSVLHLSTRPPVHLSTHPFLHSSSLPPIHFLPPNLSLIWAFQVVGLNRQKSDSFIVVTVRHSVVSDSLQPHGLHSPSGSSVPGDSPARILQPCPPPEDFPDPGTEPRCPALQADFTV